MKRSSRSFGCNNLLFGSGLGDFGIGDSIDTKDCDHFAAMQLEMSSFGVRKCSFLDVLWPSVVEMAATDGVWEYC